MVNLAKFYLNQTNYNSYLVGLISIRICHFINIASQEFAINLISDKNLCINVI
jgi:hypothetical protein